MILVAIPSRAFGDAVDDYIAGEMNKRHIPGLALAVVRDGRVEKTAGYGLANVELGAAATPKTVFQVQSVTKTFTSAAVLMLMEEGKLALEDPVGKHLLDTPDSWTDITLRHLLSHTSGIKDFINEPTASLRLDVTESEVFKATASRPLNFQPGEKYAYSNTNYHLLAMIIRQITGKPYGEFLGERIFTPLGMTSTRIVSLSEIIPNRAAGYIWSGKELRNGHFIAEPILGYGGGGVISTAEDMAKWVLALEGGKILKKETLEKAWTPAKLKSGATAPYGLGWGIGAANGHRIVSHGGSHMTGFTSSLTLYRDDGIAVIVLTNARHANTGQIAQRVAAIYVPAVAPALPKPIEDKDPKIKQMVREVVSRIAAGKADEGPFTAALWTALRPQLARIGEDLRQGGEIKSIDLLFQVDARGERAFRYRMTCAQRTWLVTLRINTEGKLSALQFEQE